MLYLFVQCFLSLRKYLIFRGKFQNRKVRRTASMKSWSSEWDSESRGCFSPEAPVPRVPRGFLHVENYLCRLKMHKLLCAYSVGKHLHKRKISTGTLRAHGHTGLSVYCVPEDIYCEKHTSGPLEYTQDRLQMPLLWHGFQAQICPQKAFLILSPYKKQWSKNYQVLSERQTYCNESTPCYISCISFCWQVFHRNAAFKILHFHPHL